MNTSTHATLALAIAGALCCAGSAHAGEPEVFAAADFIIADASGAAPGARAFSFVGVPEMLGNMDMSRFMAMEMGDGGKVVRDAPYSAEAVTETTQLLADGNRISRKSATLLYRDALGRTRQEQTAPGSSVFINDPVSGKRTILNAEKKTATVLPSFGGLPERADLLKWHELGKLGKANVIRKSLDGEKQIITQGPGGELQIIRKGADGETQIINEPGRQIVIRRKEVVHGDGKKSVEENREMHVSVVRAHEGDSAVAIAGLPLDVNSLMSLRAGKQKGVTTSLGVKDVAGVKAEGTQTVATIAAGEIGNDKPIQVISEKWFSPELQTVVYSRHSDPRSGETIYRLNNIRRAAQAPDLFAVPAGYRIKATPLPPMPPMPPLPPATPAPPAPPAK
ncbi:MAG: hypothetical protein KAX84_10145 [Burkholderiales bacterium]|nr:hypothetical protein [Burkholderiales bacterium]